MGQRFQLLILLFIFTGLAAGYGQEAVPSFREIDSVSLALYQARDWKALARYQEWAAREGYDYYYLRMRSGIASYERKNYLQAARHFRKALEHNDADPVALEYLFGCFLELNLTAEAAQTWQKLPAPAQERLALLKPRLFRAGLAAGPLISDQPEKFDTFDLDGGQDIYGETDLVTGGYNVYAGLSKIFAGGQSIYAGYTMVYQDKNKLVRISDTLAVDEQYPLRQHQYYLGGEIPVVKGFSVNPALNYIRSRYAVVSPVYNEITGAYTFPVDSTDIGQFIGYLSVTRDFQVIRTSLFAAWSNLNEQEQFQAGFRLVAYPLGNLNFYLSADLLNHMNEGNSQLVFGLLAGGRLLRPLWIEANMTAGDMRNYHDNNANSVYNVADRMKFKGGGKAMLRFDTRWMLTGEYVYMLRRGSYVMYEPLTGEDDAVVPVTMPQNFNNHLFVISLSCKF